jgi:hypothetical protein
MRSRVRSSLRRPLPEPHDMPRFLLAIGLAVECHRLLVCLEFLRAEFLRRTCDGAKMLPAILAAHQQHAHGEAAGRLHGGGEVVEGEADAAMGGRVRAGAVQTQPVKALLTRCLDSC